MDCAKLRLKLTQCIWTIHMWSFLFGGLSAKCQKDQYVLHGTNDCKLCQPPQYFLSSDICHKCRICEQEVSQACTSTSNTKCSCRSGFDCADPSCETCEKLPYCGKGEELIRQGNFQFSYICKPCNSTSYSNTENGTCKPFINCQNMGLDVVYPGNRTHNVKCGLKTETDPVPKKGQITAENVFIFGSLFIGLTCLFLLLLVCTWRTKTRASWSARHSAKYKSALIGEPSHLPFSVEERGPKTPELC